MNTDEIVKLMDEFVSHGLSRMCLKSGETELTLEKEIKVSCEPVISNVVPVANEVNAETTPAPAVVEGDTVKAPLVGTFYESPKEGAAPFVKVGDTVKAGSVMCIIEAMKMMNEVLAPYDLVVNRVCKANGMLTEFDETLFEVTKL